MYTVMVTAALGVLVICWLIWRGTLKGEGVFWGMIFGTFIGALVGVFIGAAVSSAVPEADLEYSRIPLAALRTSDDVSGTFVWATGNLTTNSNYRVMIKNEDGSMSPYSVPAVQSTRIHEKDGVTEGVMITHAVAKDVNHALYRWSVPPMGGDKGRTFWYELHVPRGTVKQEFAAR